MIKTLYNRCMGIYKFGNDTYPWRIKTQVEFRSHFSGKKVCLMGREIRYTRAVHKETELCFFKIYCFTYNLIKLVSFKVLPSTLETPLPTFFPVLECVLERVLRDGAKVPYRIFFHLLYRLKSATF